MDVIGKAVPEGKPWPVDLTVQVKMFIDQPEHDKGCITRGRIRVAPRDMKKPEDQ